MFPMLSWTGFAPGGEPFHIAVTAISPGERRLHRQDFSELFWVEEGEGWEVLPEGRIRLGAGSVGFASAQVAHGFQTDDGMRLGNLAIPDAARRDIECRYFGDPAGPASPWSLIAGRPKVFHLSPAVSAGIRRGARELTGRARNPLARDAFLLSVLRVVNEAGGGGERPLPPWLARAFADFRQPAQLAGGLNRFFALAGRSPEHVAREVRRCRDTTPREFVREVQLERAGELLLTTDIEIIDVAADCGFHNLGYFYKCFRHRYGTSPRSFRLRGVLAAVGG